MFESTLFVLGFLFLAWVVWLPEIQLVSIPIASGWCILRKSPSAGIPEAVRLSAGMVCWRSARGERAEVLAPPPDLCPQQGTNRVSRAMGIISGGVMDSTAPFFQQLSGTLGRTSKRWRLLSQLKWSSFRRRF